MEKMVYKNEFKGKEILDVDKYKGIKYYIISMGRYPCAYIKLPNSNDDILKIIDNTCHEGITYKDSYLNINNIRYLGDFVGWDYAHFGDYIGSYPEMLPDVDFSRLKRWTTEAVLDDIHEVIDAICDYEEETKPRIRNKRKIYC